jgi:hypothetical protein
LNHRALRLSAKAEGRPGKCQKNEWRSFKHSRKMEAGQREVKEFLNMKARASPGLRAL